MTFVPHEPPDHADDLARAVIGAAIEVHRHLGPGLLESAYQAALELELRTRQVSFERQKRFVLTYKGAHIGEVVIDLVVGNCLVVELKSVDALGQIHYAQVASYLRISRLPLGLLVNFNSAVLKNGIRRVLRSEPSN